MMNPAFALLMVANVALADEGMWLPEQMPALAEQLTEHAVQIPARDLSDPKGPLLGAVVSLGHCTASFVSDEGLLLTNGHCVRSYLQYASSAEQDLVKDGFSAKDHADERWAGPSARVMITERMEDVTDQVLAGLPKRKGKQTDMERAITMARTKKAIVAQCEEDSGVRCEVASFFGGLSYRLVVKREIKDVRLVYVPPDEVVTFGGDVDNWQWPRHTGDFAFLRAYVGPDGMPASHSDENQPFRPAHSVSLSPVGISPGDSVLLAGYPARTWRYRTAAEIKDASLVRYPNGISLLNDLVRINRAHAAADDEAARRVGPFVFGLANARKNYQGMMSNFSSAHIVETKAQGENELMEWVRADRKRMKTYGADLKELMVVLDAERANAERDRLVRMLARYPTLLAASRTAVRLASEREKPDADRQEGFQERDVERLQNRFAQMEHTIYLPAERESLAAILDRVEALDRKQRVPPIDRWLKAAGGRERALDQLFENPKLAEPNERSALLEMSLSDLKKSNDPWVRLAVAMEEWIDDEQATRDAYEGAMARLRPQHMKALLEMRGGVVYSDANGTLRVSVGRVEGYSPQEAVSYAPQTTLDGMLAKNGAAPFVLPSSLVVQASSDEKNRWMDTELGSVPLNFLSTLDNTGGNSGSPTFDVEGRLVGLVFDRNSEAMAADWVFDPALTRSIHVDVRFIGWMLSEFPAEEPLIQELGLSVE